MNRLERNNELILQKMKLDKFFSMFLEKFDRQMDSDNTNTPVWKLYKSKLKEYEKIDYEIKANQYWLKKEQYV